MDLRNLPARLTTEQVYAFGRIIETGSLIEVGGVKYLVAPVTPMTADFLKGAWLPEFSNNLIFNKADANIVAALDAGKNVSDEGITLEELRARMMPELQGRISVSASETYERVFRILFDVLGEKRKIKTIDRTDIQRVKQRLLDTPLWYPLRFRRLTIEQAIDKANQENLPRISQATVNHLLFRVTAIFSWAERQWLIERTPAKRIAVRANKSIAGYKRRPFSLDQLKAIFTTPLYTGCRNDFILFYKPGPNRPRKHRFWVSLIGLFSGLRLNEICQLDVADIVHVDGIWCFHVTNVDESGTRDKRVKTLAAIRHVPIHSELLRIGFLNYLEEARLGGNTKLFPDLFTNGRGMYGHQFGTWFSQRFLKAHGLYKRETTFHSFRHCFRDALRRSNASLYILRELCGWSLPQPGLEFGYGTLLSFQDLAAAIESVRYPGLDLSHLYPDNAEQMVISARS